MRQSDELGQYSTQQRCRHDRQAVSHSDTMMPHRQWVTVLTDGVGSFPQRRQTEDRSRPPAPGEMRPARVLVWLENPKSSCTGKKLQPFHWPASPGLSEELARHATSTIPEFKAKNVSPLLVQRRPFFRITRETV